MEKNTLSEFSQITCSFKNFKFSEKNSINWNHIRWWWSSTSSFVANAVLAKKDYRGKFINNNITSDGKCYDLKIF